MVYVSILKYPRYILQPDEEAFYEWFFEPRDRISVQVKTSGYVAYQLLHEGDPSSVEVQGTADPYREYLFFENLIPGNKTLIVGNDDEAPITVHVVIRKLEKAKDASFMDAFGNLFKRQR